jgi:hypothetical protein
MKSTFQTLRIWIVYQLFKFFQRSPITAYILKHYPSLNSNFFSKSSFASLILAGVVYKLVKKLFDWVLSKFGYHKMTFTDKMFLLEDKRTPANVTGCFIMDKFEYETMRDHLIQK